jgi:putative FmdB family regulatory protein
MPIYEYSCKPCGKVFEELIIRSSDEDEVACPACKSRKVSRLMSRPAASRSGDGGGAPARPARGCGPVG